MKAIISESAKASLRKITGYYIEQGYPAYADRIIEAVYACMKELERNPEMGRAEDRLARFDKDYAFILAEKYFKVIHYVNDETIYVSAVFDTRQDPEKMERDVLKSIR